jgi:four helix bundle protein
MPALRERLSPFVILQSSLVIQNDTVEIKMKGDELKRRTKEFAHRCVKLVVALPNIPLGNHIRGQLIRCSTSVASNYRAACVAQSKASFISKLSIVIEEADESCFWLEFTVDENLLKKGQVEPLLKEAEELTAIFMTSRKTARMEKSDD